MLNCLSMLGLSRDVKLLPNLLFVLQMGAIFVSNLPRFAGIHFLYGQFVLALFSFVYIYRSNKHSKILYGYLRIYAIYSACFIIGFLINGNAHIREVVNGVLIIPIIPLLLYSFHISSLVAFFQFMGVCGYIIMVILTGSVPIEEITYNSSNYLSYYAMLYSYPYYVSCYYEKKEPSIIVPLVSFFIALVALGRGGIISTGLVLLLFLFSKINTQGAVRWLYIFSMIILAGIVLAVGISDNLSMFLEASMEKFDAYGMNSRGRTLSYELYLKSLLNPFYLIAGTPISKIPYIYNYLEGHVHNSWLTLHSRIGIYSVFILYYVVLGLKKMYKKKQYYIFVILLSLLLSGFTNTDIAGSMTGGDSYLFFIIILYLEFKYYIVHKFYS